MCELNINSMSISSFWLQKTILEVKYQKDKLCYHKYKLLETESAFWSWQYMNHITNMITKEYVSCSEAKLNKTINKIIEDYKARIYDLKIFKPLIKIYCNVHVILIEEFLNELKNMLLQKEIIDENYIYKLGELLHTFIVATILEIKELTLDCGLLAQTEEDYKMFKEARKDPHCTQSIDNNDNITIFVTKAYNINSYAVKKIEKMVEVFEKELNAKSVKLTFNFKFYNSLEYIDKIINMLLKAKEHFKNIEVKNIDNSLYNHIKYILED